MTREQAEIVARLKENEVQAALLLAETDERPGLQRIRIQHIRTLAAYQLTLVNESDTNR